jgi:membrane protein
LGLVFNPYRLRKELFEDLSGTFGKQPVEQVFGTLIAFRDLASNWIITTLGVMFLLLVSTTLLMVIKRSINQIWRIKIHRKQGFIMSLLRRLQSILIIAGTGILFLISIIAEALKAFLGKGLEQLSPVAASYFTGILTYFFSLVIVTAWFGILFRILPDAKPRWKIALTGGLATAILFNIGKFFLRLLLTSSNLNSLYGTSASVVLLLLFVFYTSLIMYFGAAFTHAWAEYRGRHIRPRHYATSYRLTEVEE